MSEPDDTVWFLDAPKDGDVFITRCSRCSKRLDIEMKIHPLKAVAYEHYSAWWELLMTSCWVAGIALGGFCILRFFFGVGG